MMSFPRPDSQLKNPFYYYKQNINKIYEKQQ